MSLAIVQQVDTVAINSGVSFDMPSNVAAGDAVAMAVYVAHATDHVLSVSGLGAAWAKVGTTNASYTGWNMEWWVGTGATGGTKTVTVTTVSGANQYTAWATEVSGIASSPPAADGGNATGTSTAPARTVTGLSAGQMVLVSSIGGAAISVSPSSPWTAWVGTNYYWAPSQYFGAANQITSDSSNQTATWTIASSALWATIALILNPAATATAVFPPSPSLRSQAVQRAATR